MKFLVLVHVLSAIVGIGPTYFGLVLLGRNQNAGTLRHNLALTDKLSLFPKIGGTLAVLSGLALIVLGRYGPVTQLWLGGSLALYALIQLVIVGFAAPREKRLHAWLGTQGQGEAGGTLALPPLQKNLLGQLGVLHLLASVLGLLLFVLMILKPR